MALPVTPAETLNQQRVRRSNASATFKTIPIVYGEVIGEGEIFAIGKTSPTDWVFGVLWCYGPQVYIRNVRLNNEAPIDGTVITNYRGLDEPPIDPTLAGALVNPSYQDRLSGIAYSVITFSQDDYGSIPSFTAELGGIDGTSNPARAYRDLVTNTEYGLGLEVNEEAQAIAEAHCDQLINNTEVRYQFGLVVENGLQADRWLDILAEYAGCWSNQEEGKFALKLNFITPITARLTDADVVRDGLESEELNLIQVPTTVEVQYTDYSSGRAERRSAIYRKPSVLLGIENERVSRISMPGITRYSEAYRLAQTRQQLLDNQPYRLTCLDSRLSITRGDRITYTDADNALDLHVVGIPTRNATGLLTLQCYAYRASDYSETIVESPSFTSGKLIYE